MLRVLALASILTMLVVTVAPWRADAKGGGLETFRISGGDLPHPIVVSVPEYLMTVSGRGTWYAAAAGVAAPLASQTHYELDVVDPESEAPLEAPQQYVPGEPTRITSPDGPGWAEPIAEIDQLLDRYITLGSRGLLPERPTFAQSLSVAAGTFGASVSADRTALTPADTAHFLSLLAQAQPVVFGVQGTLVGSRNLHQVPLALRFGAFGLSMTYVPPGPIAPYGLIFNPGTAGNWEYYTLLNPPGYSTWAYTIPPELDQLMSSLGFAGAPEGDIVADRAVPLDQAQLAFGTDHLEAWRDGGAHARLQLPTPPADSEQPCADAACTRTDPAPPFAGTPLHVEEWPLGVDPFPEAVTPAEYMYYPHDGQGSERGVLVMTQMGAEGNATSGLADPYFVDAALDARLKALLAGPPARGSHLRTAIAVAVPAVLLGLLAIAYVSWDAELKRRRVEETGGSHRTSQARSDT